MSATPAFRRVFSQLKFYSQETVFSPIQKFPLSWDHLFFFFFFPRSSSFRYPPSGLLGQTVDFPFSLRRSSSAPFGKLRETFFDSPRGCLPFPLGFSAAPVGSGGLRDYCRRCAPLPRSSEFSKQSLPLDRVDGFLLSVSPDLFSKQSFFPQRLFFSFFPHQTPAGVPFLFLFGPIVVLFFSFFCSIPLWRSPYRECGFWPGSDGRSFRLRGVFFGPQASAQRTSFYLSESLFSPLLQETRSRPFLPYGLARFRAQEDPPRPPRR